MQNDNTIHQPKTTLRKVLRALAFGSPLLIVTLFVSHLVWKYSGSNKWELEKDQNGIKIYGLKVPGSSLKHFKAVTRVKTTMSRAIAPMVVKTDVATCAKWVPGCASMEILEPWSPQAMYTVLLWRVDLPFPFSPREFLLKTQVAPDPQSKAVRVDVVAIPDRLPRNSCCFRIADMHNSWRYTPLENGEVEIELSENMDVGIPYFLANTGGAEDTYKLFSKLPDLLNEEKYQNVRLDFANGMVSEVSGDH